MRDSLKQSLDDLVYMVDLGCLLRRRAIRFGTVEDFKLAVSIAKLGLYRCSRSSKYYASCTERVAGIYHDIFQVTCGFELVKDAPKYPWSIQEHDELCRNASMPIKESKILDDDLDSKDLSDDGILPDVTGLHDHPTSIPVLWSGSEWKVLQRAMVTYRCAVALATNDLERMKHQEKLATVLRHRFDHLGSGDDLLEAAKLLQSLVDTRIESQGAHEEVLGTISETACVLKLQYDIFRDVRALEASIRLLRRSLEMATNASDIVNASLGLSATLSSYFHLYQNVDSQNEAIELLCTALKQEPQSTGQRWGLRANLAKMLYDRCLHVHDLNGIATSLKKAWKALVVDLDHAQQKKIERLMWRIGGQVCAYYDPAECGAYHDELDIIEMARPIEEPANTIPLCGPISPFAKGWRRVEHAGYLGGASQDLKDAIYSGTEALIIIPKHDSCRPRLLHQLATFHVHTYRTHKPSDAVLGYDESTVLKLLDEAETTSSGTHDRICVHRSKMKLLARLGRWSDAVVAAEAAEGYIPVLARENVRFKDRLRKLRSVHGLAADAAIYQSELDVWHSSRYES